MDYPPLIPAPDDPRDWPEWRQALAVWREGLTLDRKSYADPQFAWVRDCVICAKVMLFDREFYDPVGNRFRVEDYVDRLKREYGGLDALVLWQAYPRVGVDPRNQYDHYRLAPSLKGVVDTLHRLGVKALMAYNPWDVSTRREKESDSEAIAKLIREFGFDGVFLDTLNEGPDALRRAIDRAKPGVAMESELALPVEGIPAHHASWAQWLQDGEAPGILRNHWAERGHMMHLVRRWDTDHSGELHLAWMNGVGVLVWENVFGSWNGWSDRDKAILRAFAPIRRRYADLFYRGEWTPLVDCSLPGVYASRWRHEGTTLWTFVNRTRGYPHGTVLPIATDGAMRLFDLVQGIEVDHAELRFHARGIGALLYLPASRVDDDFRAFLEGQRERYQSSDAPPTRVEPLTVRVSPQIARHEKMPNGMLPIEAGTRTILSRFLARECGEYGPAPMPNFVYPDLHFERRIQTEVAMGRYAVDDREVTNREFLAFLNATQYRPAVPDSFLAHWENGQPRRGTLDAPVVFVTLDDARAYARWAKKRLPTEYEWQVAAEEYGFPTQGIANWTESEHSDGHTRFSILKGSTAWKADGSQWYVPTGNRPPNHSVKLIHFFPALDRTETIGFRCAIDL